MLFELDIQLEFQRHRVLVGEATLCTLHWQGIISVVNRGESKSLGSTKYVVTTTTHSPMCEEGKICPLNQTIQKTHFPIQRLHYSPTRIRLSRETHFKIQRVCSYLPKTSTTNVTLALVLGFTITYAISLEIFSLTCKCNESVMQELFIQNIIIKCGCNSLVSIQ